MAKASNNHGLKTYFEQVYGKKLSDAEVLEYKNRLVKFFSLLIEIDQRNKRKEVSKYDPTDQVKQEFNKSGL